MIRLATPEDYELVCDYVVKLKKASIYGRFFKGQEVTKELYLSYIEHPREKMIVIIQSEDGEDVGFAAFDMQAWPYLNKEIKFARMPYVYIEPKFRKKGLMADVLEGFEYWAKQVGALYCTLGPKAKKRGYKKSEVVFIKEV